MRERKATMEEISDMFVALPGSFGTLEEISEIIVAKQLSFHKKAVVFLNTDNFYVENLIKVKITGSNPIKSSTIKIMGL